MRPAAAAWERLYSEFLESKGFERGVSCGVVFYHKGMDVACAVHGDDFTFCGLRENLLVVQGWLREAFEIEVRGMLGESDVEDKEAVILGRTVRWLDDGIEYEADTKHRQKLLEYFHFDDYSKTLGCNGDRLDHGDEGWLCEKLVSKAVSDYRGLAARLNCMSLDCPDLQYPN